MIIESIYNISSNILRKKIENIKQLFMPVEVQATQELVWNANFKILKNCS